jgi:diguanylate cyclase (GGDEF)-like protein
MTATPPAAGTRRPRTLQRALYRIHLSIAAVAVALAASLLLLGGTLALRYSAENNLRLVARSIGYTAEAALVFKNKAAAAEILQGIARNENLARAEILDADGQIVASWAAQDDVALAALERWTAEMVLKLPHTETIIHDNMTVGEVRIWASGSMLLRFLLVGAWASLACLAISMLLAMRLSRRMLGSIMEQLQSLARVTHQVRLKRDFSRRVGTAPISEFNELGDDFNALLDELSAWQAVMQSANARLMHEATHDELTGLPIRGLFEARLNRAIAEARADGSMMAVFFVDSDHFKQVNDAYGHAAGDAVLVVTAKRLRKNLRNDDLVARIGGDEFAVLLTSLRAPADAGRIAASIIASQSEPIILADGRTVSATVSIGIALFPTHAHDAKGLLRAADAAMYDVKRQTRGAWKLLDRFQNDRAITEMDL